MFDSPIDFATGLLLLAGLALWTQVARGRCSVILRPVVDADTQATALPENLPLAVLVAVYTLVRLPALWSFERLETPSPLPEFRQLLDAAVFVVLQIALFSLILAVGSGTRLQDWGITGREPLRQGTLGVLGFVASFLPVMCSLWLTMSWRSPETQHVLLRLLADEPSAKLMALIAVKVIVLAPFIEELQYRVILQSTLVKRCGPAWGIGITAVLFCLVHGWPDALPLLPLALILGWLYFKTRSFAAAVLTHALFNGWQLVTLLLSQSG